MKEKLEGKDNVSINKQETKEKQENTQAEQPEEGSSDEEE